jgi:hypothetical protein
MTLLFFGGGGLWQGKLVFVALRVDSKGDGSLYSRLRVAREAAVAYWFW